MIFLKYLFLTAGILLFTVAAAVVLYDVVEAVRRWRLLARAAGEGTAPAARLALRIRWSLAGKLALVACLPILLSISIVVVPSGYAGVRVSQLYGTRPGTLYPGVHFVKPLLEQVVTYDVRDHIFTAGQPTALEGEDAETEMLEVQAKEGLVIGLAIAVRYRLDPERLDHIHANLPQPVERQIVPPVVASVFRQVVPNFTVREVFSARREEIRQRAADAITQKLAADAVVVKEVMMRDIVLPAEYAKGLEGMLLKEQENERLTCEIEIKKKQVRTAELEAEAQKTRDVKRAEAQAQVLVLQAKGEADAMQHTLPLKEKQIQQTRLEAQARKEATLQNAEAAAQAKVIDSKAELERRKLLAEADGNRIRVISAADAERLKLEALVLKQNPLLIQKIIAEKLSDKVQIMMVPTDGKFFFANDVLRSTVMQTSAESEDAPRKPNDRP